MKIRMEFSSNSDRLVDNIYELEIDDPENLAKIMTFLQAKILIAAWEVKPFQVTVTIIQDGEEKK